MVHRRTASDNGKGSGLLRWWKCNRNVGERAELLFELAWREGDHAPTRRKLLDCQTCTIYAGVSPGRTKAKCVHSSGTKKTK